jgi:HEAT repeat protein
MPAGASAPEKVRTTGALRQFLGLFVVPLLVVAMCVGVFVMFGWVAYDRNSVGDYLDDLRDSRSVFAHRRKQAAYELSKILSADPEALQREPGAGAELRRLFQTSEDLWVRRYMALVLGHIGDTEAVPLLIEGASDMDSQVRIYSLWALGAIEAPLSKDVLLTAVQDPDPGIRKTAAFALGGFEEEGVIEALTVASEDPVADVRWNASLALAQLGSALAVPVLEQMLDRRLLAQVPEITVAQQEQAMIGALAALAKLPQHLDRATIDRLADEDPSLKVRQAAIETRRALDPAL